MKTIILALIALGVCTGLGYFLRLIISLGKKGSIELEVKQLLVQAKEEAQKIIADAKNKELEVHEEVKKIEKEKETEGMKNIRQNSAPAQADHVVGIRGSPKDPGSTADTQAVQTQGANLDTTEKI